MAIVLPSQLDPLEAHEIPAQYNQPRIEAFVEKTRASGGAELANAQSIVRELCEVLGVAPPDLKSSHADNAYCFEEDTKEVKAHRRIDVYKRGCFVFECKQGVDPAAGDVDAIDKAAVKAKTGHSKTTRGAGVRGTDKWLDAMSAGRHQAGNYAVSVTARKDPKPPFLIVADLGYRFWVWSSFQPDPKDDYGDFELLAGFQWAELARPEVFKLLRLVWEKPEELNEEVQGQRITAAIAEKVSELAVRLEKRLGKKHGETIGDFLMKCVFTMFAEDVDMIPRGVFSQLLAGWILRAKAGHPEDFVNGLRALWSTMNTGGSLLSGAGIPQFNGYLFKNVDPIALDIPEMEALYAAAAADWRRVSPAIFGTLLERALTPEERQKLGAYYTPEAYIRRLVDKTVIAPLRIEWRDVCAAMENELLTAKAGARAVAEKNAVALGATFRHRLATVRVLDPACGSGNFLYVALKELKRLEAEVDRYLAQRKGYKRAMDYQGESVHPAQFHGIEVKPWAAKVAELVLWIGYLQWQMSAGRFAAMQQPLIQDLHHIECRDALIKWTKTEPSVDADGNPVLRAVGVTDKQAERRMIEVKRYVGVKMAAWPDADFVVGNPPFLGNKRMNDVLPSGYVDAIKEAYPAVPGTADLVMWWWWRCAELVAKGKLQRFGLVTTNSITQKFNRGVTSEALTKGLRLAYAIPDHPWYDEGAAVRIAMTVAEKTTGTATLGRVVYEARTKAADLDLVEVDEREVAEIHQDLSAGANVTAAVALKANERLCYQGMNLVGEGFRLTATELASFGISPNALPPVVKPYVVGKELVQRTQDRYVIDFFGLDPAVARKAYPGLWNHLARHVKPERAKNNRPLYKSKWWLFGEVRPGMRRSLGGLPRYVATGETAKHRVFQFLAGGVTPDHKVYAIASTDAFVLGVLSSRVHVTWALAAGGTLEDRPTWTNTTCFLKFPFPEPSSKQRACVRKLAEAIDTHRRTRQKKHPYLTLTDAYNVLAKLRAGETLTADDEKVRDIALVDTLLHLHDELDAAVLDAYGWPKDITDDDILTRLVALNAERAAEEANGIIRWLRPEFQAPKPVQSTLAMGEGTVTDKGEKRKKKATATLSWPRELPARIEALIAFLRREDRPVSTSVVAAAFKGAAEADVWITLKCAAAAQAVTRYDEEDGSETWAGRA